MQVTTPRTWLALVAFGVLLLAGIVWSALTFVSTTVHAQGVVAPPGREAFVFLSPEQASRLRPGMTAHVTAPILINGAQLSVTGRVASVGRFPLGAPALARMIGSSSSASLLASSDQLIPVRVAFLQSAPIPGPTTLRTPCRADITVSSQRLIHVIVP
ncbi:MAG TPA: hypothetical protein VF221_00890 [Chloroflexota bacterium]